MLFPRKSKRRWEWSDPKQTLKRGLLKFEFPFDNHSDYTLYYMTIWGHYMGSGLRNYSIINKIMPFQGLI